MNAYQRRQSKRERMLQRRKVRFLYAPGYLAAIVEGTLPAWRRRFGAVEHLVRDYPPVARALADMDAAGLLGEP